MNSRQHHAHKQWIPAGSSAEHVPSKYIKDNITINLSHKVKPL